MSTTEERQYWRDNPDSTNDLDIFLLLDEIDTLARENERLLTCLSRTVSMLYSGEPFHPATEGCKGCDEIRATIAKEK